MNKRMTWSLVIALLLAALLVTACAAGDGGQTEDSTGEDGTNGQSQVEQPQDEDVLADVDENSTVVALSRSVGELWTLAGGTLAGVTEDGLDLGEGITSIGTLLSPSLEQILALEPDLVMLTQDIPSHQELRAPLGEAGVPVLVVDINSFDDYADVMAELTAATGREDLYDLNVTQVRARIDDTIEHATHAKGASYLVLRTSATKNRVLKADNFVCAMLDDLGLANVADDSSAFDDLSLEAIADADPDWIFVVYQGETDEAQQAFEKAFQDNPVWGELTATTQGHVVTLPKNLFQYKPNARWSEAYAYLSQVLHGAWA